MSSNQDASPASKSNYDMSTTIGSSSPTDAKTSIPTSLRKEAPAIVEDTDEDDDDSLNDEDNGGRKVSDNKPGLSGEEDATNDDNNNATNDEDDLRFLSTVLEEEDYDDEDEADGNDNAAMCARDNNEDSEPMPLFQYTRLYGSLPRAERTSEQPSPPLSTPRTSSVLGKVILSPETTLGETDTTAAAPASTATAPNSETNILSSSRHGARTSPPTAAEYTTSGGMTVPPELWQQQPIPIAAFGFANGELWLVDALTGIAVAGPDKLPIRETTTSAGGRGSNTSSSNNNQNAIVGLSMDASGTFLAAVDASGKCAIFEMKYGIRLVPASQVATQQTLAQQQQQHGGGGGNVFSHFMSAFTGGGGGGSSSRNSSPRDASAAASTTTPSASADEQDTTINGESQEPDELVPTLTLASVQVQRISYPASFGKPTCLAIDPAYKRRREKALMVGFSDGKLVMTKRGFVFQRRNDAVLYQAVKGDDHHFAGIEAITWRGSLVAWADSSGVRLLDSDALQRIAHVDRPSGARPSLYPSVSHVKPSLCFETNRHLLVGWGDCLLTLHVEETTAALPPASSETQAQQQQQQQPVRRRHVVCSMAWELDCIACDIAPLDAKHVVVLGLVPPAADDEITTASATPRNAELNEVELQVVSRVDGEVVFADMLPLVRVIEPVRRRGRNHNQQQQQPMDSTAHYQLMSSFAVPRMDVAMELQEIKNIMSGEEVVFRDSHLAWSVDNIIFKDEDLSVGKTSMKQGITSDAASCGSDDYSLPLDPVPDDDNKVAEQHQSYPPVLIVASARDSVVARTRGVDDAISAALQNKRPALALHRALQHKRQLRQYRLDDLVNEYLRALLCLRESDIGAGKKVSMRRMKLAARAMPILLGGHVKDWEYWIREMEKLPGALFVIRNSIPVRDPKLRREVYAQVLSTMLKQVDEVKHDFSSETVAGRDRIVVQAEEQFLDALVSWGTTNALKDFCDLMEYQAEKDVTFKYSLEAVNTNLARRYEQTAAVYLSADLDQPARTGSVSPPTHSNDSLYDMDAIRVMFEARIPGQLHQEPKANSKGATVMLDGNLDVLALDAMAKISIMMGKFEAALKYFLVVGAVDTSQTIEEVEEKALEEVSNLDKDDIATKHQKLTKYAFVVRFIEKHHLHQYVLENKLLPTQLGIPPLFALAKLVGLDLLAQFILDHLVEPQKMLTERAVSSSHMQKRDERRGTLPLDSVAGQFQSSPKLLHWFLHLVFVNKPELYIKFPNTANLPPAISALHQRQFALHIKYAGTNKDSKKVLDGVEAYRVADRTTPFLAFLKGVLPLGSLESKKVARALQDERRGGSARSRTFALELAYIVERYGEGLLEDAVLVLELYLKGAESLVLAVSFAERCNKYSQTLWQTLIEYCLGSDDGTKETSVTQEDGTLFGSLLEAAALSGADLAHLVKQIPTGMAIEGLRPRLVAAVADYRLKLQMHESADAIAVTEKIALLRECGHRVRRGVFFDAQSQPAYPDSGDTEVLVGKRRQKQRDESGKRGLPSTLRTTMRQDRHRLAYSIPIR